MKAVRHFFFSILVFTFLLLFYSQACAKSTVKPVTVRLAVAETSGGNAENMAAWLESCGGCRAEWVNSAKINPKKYDGLVIPGGGDVTPSLYKAGRHELTYGTSLARDRLQISLVKKFAKAGKPVLGVCRGCQVINVAYGGTLIQHLKTGWHTGWHTACVYRKSVFRSVYGRTESLCHSHHQAVRKPGKGIIVTIRDVSTGTVEGIQHKELPVYGIQWHPEFMGETGRKAGRIFIRLCRKARKVRRK